MSPSLRKQWQQELFDKFLIKNRIVEAKTYNDMKKGGLTRRYDRLVGAM